MHNERFLALQSIKKELIAIARFCFPSIKSSAVCPGEDEIINDALVIERVMSLIGIACVPTMIVDMYMIPTLEWGWVLYRRKQGVIR